MSAYLTNEQTRVLHVLQGRGRVVAERTFPHPLRYWLYRRNDEGGALTRVNTPLAAALLPSLVVLGLVKATVVDPRYAREGFADSIDYTITEAGTDAAIQGGEVHYDDQWAGDLFPDTEAA